MIIVPFINSLRFSKQGFTSSYQTKYFDENLYPETILDFEEKADYAQPWQVNDLINLFIYSTESDSTKVKIDFFKQDTDALVWTTGFTFVTSTTIDGTTFYAYRCSTDTSNLGTGDFYSILTDGTTNCDGCKMNICTSQKQTVLVKFRHSKFYEDVLWEQDVNWYMYVRIDGFVRHHSPLRNSTTYENQILSVAQLKTVPYNGWTYVTDQFGMPTYMIDITNRVFGCDYLLLDGRGFTVPQDSKWEEKEEDRYPMRGWGIDLRESNQKSSASFDGSTGGIPLPTVPKTEIVEDHWPTIAGTSTLLNSAFSVKYGYTVSNIYKLLDIEVEGINYDIVVVSSPVGRQAKHDAVTPKIDFDSAIPFNSGATVKMIFKKLL